METINTLTSPLAPQQAPVASGFPRRLIDPVLPTCLLSPKQSIFGSAVGSERPCVVVLITLTRSSPQQRVMCDSWNFNRRVMCPRAFYIWPEHTTEIWLSLITTSAVYLACQNVVHL